jgi:hypothetical protein
MRQTIMTGGPIKGRQMRSAEEAPSTARLPMVMGELQRLGSSVARARELSETLSRRLSPVMRQEPQPPTMTGEDVPRGRPNCEMAAAVAEMADNVDAVVGELNTVLGLLEV